MNSLTFNSHRKSYVIVLEKRHPFSSGKRRELIRLKGKSRALMSRSESEPLIISVILLIDGNDPVDLKRKAEDLVDWLSVDHDVPLIFDDDPERTYFAVVEGEIDPEVHVTFAKVTINFLCADPCKYGSRKELAITDASAPVILQSTGTAPTPPTFNVTLKGPTEFLDIVGDEDYMRIGSPSKVDETPFQKKETIKSLRGSLVGWTSALFTPDGGVKTGEFGLASQDYVATSYGTGSTWHGPALAQSVGSVEDDYLVRAYFNVGSNNGSRTRAEVYLLDEAGLIIGKLAAVVRRASGEVDIEINIRNGSDSHFFVSDKWNYKEFFGYIDIQKEGNVFIATAAQQGFNENGELYTRNKKTYLFNDLNNQYQKPLAAVGMHIGSHGSHPFPTQSRIRRIDVQRINDQPNGIEYIGQTGDVFRFDHGQEAIYKNDELFMRKDFGARFFHLKKGDNVLFLSPTNVIQEFKAEWRERYK
ncbi:distal tail protein Dit [Bacillus suaedae]|uniref:Phage tail family protein n=1 Tax=Halalkalibacter suaedae TaxID=2822140 RepID=A0A940WPM3_9BACI|nr:phage tail family protein [Bacillus suaedae]